MSVETLLTMTCTIRRRASGTNSSGEANGAFADNQLAVACRYSQRGEEQQGGAEEMAPSQSVVNRGKVFFAYGTDITAKDAIADVVNEDGVTIVASCEIEKTNPDPGGRQSHVEVWVREVRFA